MSSLYNDPQHWRNRAAEARAVADKITDSEAKRRMIEIAYSYDKIADRAELKTMQRWPQPCGNVFTEAADGD